MPRSKPCTCVPSRRPIRRWRFSLSMLAAVSPKDEFRFMLHNGTVTAPVFKTFLLRYCCVSVKVRPDYLFKR